MGSFRNGRINNERETQRRAPLLPKEIEEQLATQSDVVGWWQLDEAGVGADQIQSLIDGGMLRSLPGRTWTTRRAPLCVDGRRWSALLGCGPGARLTGPTVLHLAGVREDSPERVHVVVTGSAQRRTPGVRRYRTRHLPAHDCRLWGDFPGTSVTRALVDAAADSTLEELSDDLDRAVMLGLYDEAALTLARAARPRLRGSERLARAIITLDEHSGQFRSVFEQRVVRLIQTSAVIGDVVVNVLIDGYRPDIHVVGTPVIIECDGRDYHRSLAQVIADEEREEALRALGFVILRLRWSQLRYEPEQTLARIERFVLANVRTPSAPR